WPVFLHRGRTITGAWPCTVRRAVMPN
ncbi:uncharacterized protein METZ01_LOCUS372643, partial [marine metagenome]